MNRGGSVHIQWVYKDRAEAIREAIKSGWPYAKITEVYGISAGHISNINHGKYYYDKNVDYPLRKTSTCSQRANKIKKLLSEGKSNIEIIQETGASDETIRRINNGITYKDNNYKYPIRSL